MKTHFCETSTEMGLQEFCTNIDIIWRESLNTRDIIVQAKSFQATSIISTLKPKVQHY